MNLKNGVYGLSVILSNTTEIEIDSNRSTAPGPCPGRRQLAAHAHAASPASLLKRMRDAVETAPVRSTKKDEFKPEHGRLNTNGQAWTFGEFDVGSVWRSLCLVAGPHDVQRLLQWFRTPMPKRSQARKCQV